MTRILTNSGLSFLLLLLVHSSIYASNFLIKDIEIGRSENLEQVLEIRCPDDITTNTNSGCFRSGLELGTPTITNNVSLSSLTNNAADQFFVGTTIVNWTVVDVLGEQATCQQTITILDDIYPAFVFCVPNVTVITDADDCYFYNLLQAPIVTDNCGISALYSDADYPLLIGNHAITWTVVDPSGLSATCEQSVLVVDNTPPELICPDNIEATPLGLSAFVNVNQPAASDNCEINYVVNDYNQSDDASDIYYLGYNEVNWTVADVNGNTNSCSFIVKVIPDGGVAPCNQEDKNTLETLKNSWSQLAEISWDFTQELDSTWEGISLTSDGCEVESIILEDKLLNSEIPLELSQLNSLKELTLVNCNLQGQIPVEIGQITSLEHLNLFQNELSGNLPESLGNLSNLSSLNLASNQLAGCIPNSFQSLCGNTSVSLSQNFGLDNFNFSTFCSDNLGACNSCYEGDKAVLEELYNEWGVALTNWDFNTNEPPNNSWQGITMSESGCRVEELFLSAGLNGIIPESIGTLDSLTALGLWGNPLTGNIPGSIGGLENLNYLGLFNNQLTNTIPESLGSLSLLTSLDLSSNQLTGNIPESIGDLPVLNNVYLSNNQLSGSIPESLGNLATSDFIQILLYNNQLTGVIPETLGNFENLLLLELQNNNLEGCIPLSLQSYCGGPGIINLQNNPLLYNNGFVDICQSLEGSCTLTNISLALKTYLEGPYFAGTGLMNDFLRVQESFPLLSPYNNEMTEIADPNILLVNDNNAIVDWILVELKDGDDPTNVIYSQSALLQRDGDIVSPNDGVSPMTFNKSFGN